MISARRSGVARVSREPDTLGTGEYLVCPNCGRAFEAEDRRRRYCSALCRGQAAYQRVKGKAEGEGSC